MDQNNHTWQQNCNKYIIDFAGQTENRRKCQARIVELRMYGEQLLPDYSE